MSEEDAASEEFVEDESGDDDESEASFASEDDNPEESAVEESDDFETPQKTRKRQRASQSTSKGNSETAAQTPAQTSGTSPKQDSATKKRKGKARASLEETLASSTPASPENTSAAKKGKRSVSEPSPPSKTDDGGAPAGSVPTKPSEPKSTPASPGASAKVKADSGAPSVASKAVKTPKVAVSDLMLQSNRPYSCINVFDNLHKKIPKAMVQKLLDELTREGTLKMQEYSKSKIYYPNQEALPNGAGDVSDAKLQRLDREAKDLSSRLEVVSREAREAHARVQALASQPTDQALDEMLGAATRDLEDMEARNAGIKGQGRSSAAGGMKKAKVEFNKFRSLWVTRKRNAMDVVDMIADGMEKKPKAVMEMLGLEIDEGPIPAKM